jgi:predicted dehydrogenase
MLMVGHNTRRRRVFRRAKELLQQAAIGRVVAAEGNLSRPAGLQPGLPPWKADPSSCPLLPMTQLGIHLVDTVAYLISPIEQVSCFAAQIAMPGSVYDTTAAILRLENGVPFSLASYYVSPDAYFLRIYGTQGIIHCYPTALRMETTRNGEPHDAPEEDFSDEGAESYILQMKEFGECILHGRPPETGGEEGLKALAVIEAMTHSVIEGRHIAIRDIIHKANRPESPNE